MLSNEFKELYCQKPRKTVHLLLFYIQIPILIFNVPGILKQIAYFDKRGWFPFEVIYLKILLKLV